MQYQDKAEKHMDNNQGALATTQYVIRPAM